jgi:ATP-binding cassette subfamily B (MDR/TAP) protein 1
MDALVTKWTKLSLKHRGDGGTLTEEVISTIRTAHAFGTQEKLADLYDVHVSKGQEADVKEAIIQGAGLGLLFFFVYCADGLCA